MALHGEQLFKETMAKHLQIRPQIRYQDCVSWDFAGAVSIFEPNALPVVHQWLLPGLEPATSRVRVAAHNH